MHLFEFSWLTLYVLVLIGAFCAWASFRWPAEARAAWHKLGDFSRAAPLLLVFALTFAVVLTLNPAKAGLALWGASKIALCAYLGYWADRLCFRPEDRPHTLEGISKGTAWKRRALIVAAAIIAGGMIP